MGRQGKDDHTTIHVWTCKTHKENFPIRPIIIMVGSATYNLSKYLIKILSPLVGAISNSHIKNNLGLIAKLN